MLILRKVGNQRWPKGEDDKILVNQNRLRIVSGGPETMPKTCGSLSFLKFNLFSKENCQDYNYIL